MSIASRLRELVEKAEKWSNESVDEGLGFLEPASRLYIAFLGDGYGEAAAYLAYWFVRVLAPNLYVEIHSGEDLTYHVFAYQEETTVANTRVAVFAEEGVENSLARLADAARLTGTRLLIVAPPTPPIIEARLGEPHVRVLLGGNATLEALFYAAKLGFELGRRKGVKSFRTDRLGGEIGNYAEVVEELVEKYRDFIESVKSVSGDVAIAFTPTMKPAAILLRSYFEAKGVQASMMTVAGLVKRLSTGKVSRNVVLLCTDVEEDSVREARFKASMMMPSRQPKLIELHMKTDPLTAPIYASILVYSLAML